MERALERLERVLELEKEQGYQNKAVVGGIRQFAVYWVTQAQEEAVDEADQALAEQISDVLMQYGRLSGTEARQKAIATLFESIARRRARVGTPAPQAKPAPQTTPPPPRETPQAPPPRESKPPAPPRQKEPRQQVDSQSSRPQRKETAQAPVAKRPPEEPDVEGLSQSVSALKGVGPKTADLLANIGATTIWELLYLFPRRYDDYSVMKPINELAYGEQVTIIGTIWQTRVRRTRTNQTMIESIISDGTGNIKATWFNQPWLKDQLAAGMQIVLSGKVDLFLGRLVFNSPVWEPLEMDPLKTRRIVPVYPLTQGLQANKLREIMQRTVDEWAPRVPDPLPDEIRRRHRFMRLTEALQQIHFPDNQQALEQARRRMAFDELLLLQLGMQGQRQAWTAQPGLPVGGSEAVLGEFMRQLPFEPTKAQRRVISEIIDDMTVNRPMNRLLQGDVGSGKTAVAAAAMVVAARDGKQAALMAPTEILAEQHFAGLRGLLEPLGVTVGLLTGSTPAKEREALLAALADGQLQVIIGTHALIQPTVQFQQLALAVIDEQHRFGVDQRGALREKGPESDAGRISPHLLVMSATPIPRTLALSFYGDLDVSVIDEMPPGRQEIKTRWLRATERERAYRFISKQVAEGRQAFVIYPLVEESGSIDAPAAVAEYERLQQEVFPDLKVGLVHGRLRSEEKDLAMRAFAAGETSILVATSVIEVGVDVPNSSVMVIESADRFGLAQLHQFRGRVGRGQHASYCILIADEVSNDAEQRLGALEETNDGFILAERDLELRGPGEFFGRRQSGLPELKLASLLHDMDVMVQAQTEAVELFKVDPALEAPEHRLLRDLVAQFWQSAGDIS